MLISSSKPSAITIWVEGARFGGDTKFISQGVFWTTLVAPFTIPLVVTLVEAWVA